MILQHAQRPTNNIVLLLKIIIILYTLYIYAPYNYASYHKTILYVRNNVIIIVMLLINIATNVLYNK